MMISICRTIVAISILLLAACIANAQTREELIGCWENHFLIDRLILRSDNTATIIEEDFTGRVISPNGTWKQYGSIISIDFLYYGSYHLKKTFNFQKEKKGFIGLTQVTKDGHGLSLVKASPSACITPEERMPPFIQQNYEKPTAAETAEIPNAFVKGTNGMLVIIDPLTEMEVPNFRNHLKEGLNEMIARNELAKDSAEVLYNQVITAITRVKGKNYFGPDDYRNVDSLDKRSR